jgi:hypothetical protein
MGGALRARTWGAEVVEVADAGTGGSDLRGDLVVVRILGVVEVVMADSVVVIAGFL